jgi:ABC-2 type transport system permease protein
MAVRTISFPKYWKTATMAATVHAGDNPLYLVADYLLRFLRVAVLLAIWRTILAGRGSVSGLSLGAVLTYTLISEVFGEQFFLRTNLTDALWQGTIATRLLWPMGAFVQFGVEMAGFWSVGLLLFSLPLLLAAPLLGVSAAPASLGDGLLFVPSLLLAISVGLAVEFIFGSLVVILEQNIWVVMRLRSAVGVLLSGALIPLALLPWGLGAIFGLLPFAAMASAPLRIYTGSGNAATLLLSQAFWSIILWPVARRLWDAGREKLVGYGG